ncbi:beta family protein [Oceanobacter kriegii]|uniref:beta family protein n=1 Tax=Oceanobacter kriegii TaxID=64972 RepID=UPI000423147A|nr:beta family protein [Oceanobacter kriegii]
MYESTEYLPILSLSPAEIMAFSELPDKDKKNLSPCIKLKGWLAAKDISNSISKLESLGAGNVILDLDYEYVFENKDYLVSGSFPRPVYEQLKALMDPTGGYKNWTEFVLSYDWCIPVIQTEEFDHVIEQCQTLTRSGRQFVIRFSLLDIETGRWLGLINMLSGFDPCLIIFDFGRIDSGTQKYNDIFLGWLEKARSIFPSADFCISGSSFPDGFGGTENGENPICERLLYNNLIKNFRGNLIYSDYASARVKENRGGGGVPVPRIDFPLKNSWRYVRYREGSIPNRTDQYRWAANEIMVKDYWQPELKVWGTQMIELTAQGNDYAISTPMKSTAVRINIHLYNQLHYDEELSEIDSDEDWED